MHQAIPIAKDLVLLGGGHSHVIVLRMLAMNPIPGLQVTLVSPDTETLYSGMLPGVVAGHYTRDEIHIDLVPLCRFAGVRFIMSTATGIDPILKRIDIENRPAIEYDVLSIDIGITPEQSLPASSYDQVIPVKPLNKFLANWDKFLQRVSHVHEVGIVGAGAGGVEICLAINHRLQTEFDVPPGVHLFTDDPNILITYPQRVQERFEKHLSNQNIKVHTNFQVVEIRDHKIWSASGQQVDLDEVFWVTAAASQGWLAETGLPVDEAGFVEVRDTLQVVGFDDVFACGDIAHVLPHPRPKAGVYAVRQGPVLFDNLRRYLLGKPPKAFSPQQEFLTLLSTGNRYAVASRNGLSIEGRLIWQWKNWIDRRFMNRFRQLPKMKAEPREGLIKDFDEQMFCGGCGSKVSADLLRDVLQEISVNTGNLDDAAIFEVPDGKLMLHSVDVFKSFTDDPYVFAQIAVHHALSDIYAMGGQPVTALAIITVPYAKPRITRSVLRQLLLGAKVVLDHEGVELTGGHTSEGSELSVGFAVNGIVNRDELMQKSGMRDGEMLVLTKAIGTGILFAADMQHRADGRWIEQALVSMNQSNAAAMRVLKKAGVISCTDITGFGLGGHLWEMLQASNKGAILKLDELPILEGAETLFIDAGIKSTLHESNERSIQGVDPSDHRLRPFLFDPQTSGGLLASVPEDKMIEVLDELRQAGYERACCIGRVCDRAEVEISFN